MFFKWFLPSGSPTKTQYAPLLHMCYMSCPSQSSWFGHPNDNWWGVRARSSLLCSLLHSPVTSSVLGPLLSKTLILHSFLSVNDQVSKPYKTTSKLHVCTTLSLWIFQLSVYDPRPWGEFVWNSMGNHFCTNTRTHTRSIILTIRKCFFSDESLFWKMFLYLVDKRYNICTLYHARAAN